MKRKLVRQGKQAYTITLPIEWVRENGLTVGDEIDIETHEKNLLLSSDGKYQGGKITLNLEGYKPRIKYLYLNAAYAKGFDEVDLTTDRGDHPDMGPNLGFAVVRQKGNKAIIKDVGGVSNADLDEIFKRVFQMILDFYDQAIDDVTTQGNTHIESLKTKDLEINKFSLFLQRNIMNQTYPERKMGKILFAYSYMIEALGDDVFRFWRAFVEKKSKLPKQVMDFVLLSRKSLDDGFAIYFRTNNKDILHNQKIKFDARKQVSELMQKYPKYSLIILYAFKIIEDVFDLTSLSLMKWMKG